MNSSHKAMILSEILMDSSSDSQDELDMGIAFLDEVYASSSSSVADELDFEPEQHAAIQDFMKVIEDFSEIQFKSHMRLKRPTVEFLILNYSQSTFAPETTHGRRPRIGCRKEICMYIWYISNTITFRQLANLFGVAKSSGWHAVRRVSWWLISISHEYVKWPRGAAAEENKRKFEQKKKIPGVIGAIDCSHIVIRAPKVAKECYFNRKQNYSIVLQAVVDAEKRFTSFTCGEPGSLHDSRVLRRSNLYVRVHNNYADMFPNNSFIIGDSAYPATAWLVPPFKDNGSLTDTQRTFNHLHSATRMVVENAFGLLKGRFRRLSKFTEQTNLSAVTNLVASACVLHNICITKDDLCIEIFPEEENGQAEIENQYSFDDSAENISLNRRQLLFNYLQQRSII